MIDYHVMAYSLSNMVLKNSKQPKAVFQANAATALCSSKMNILTYLLDSPNLIYQSPVASAAPSNPPNKHHSKFASDASRPRCPIFFPSEKISGVARIGPSGLATRV
jgi:hypothetical protein